MNKMVFALAVVTALVAGLLVTGQVFAQGPDSDPLGPGYGNGGGNRGSGAGLLHDAMLAVFAQELDLPVEELEARLDGGETMAQIASAQGLAAEDFDALMLTARSQAIEQAVASGTITQEQANWMNERGAGRNGGARRGMHMQGAGAGSPDCPYN